MKKETYIKKTVITTTRKVIVAKRPGSSDPKYWDRDVTFATPFVLDETEEEVEAWSELSELETSLYLNRARSA